MNTETFDVELTQAAQELQAMQKHVLAQWGLETKACVRTQVTPTVKRAPTFTGSAITPAATAMQRRLQQWQQALVNLVSGHNKK